MTQPPTNSSSKRHPRLLLVAVLVIVGIGFAWQPASRFLRLYRPAQQDLPLPADLWAMNAGKGAALTARNTDDADFSPLKSVFEAQIYGAYCGVASAVIALKSLGNTTAEQKDFFTAKAEAVRGETKVFYGGMSLDELGGLLRAHGAETTVVHASESNVDAFRREAIANVERTDTKASRDILLVNYLRKAIGQKTGGHVSPIAAYDAETDRFLVLDVSTYKYPPVWVETAALFNAMNTVDGSVKLSRGWVHVRLPRAS